MAYRRPVRLCCGALATGLVLAGCSAAGDGGNAKPTASKDATASRRTSSTPAPAASSGTSAGSTPAPTPSGTGLDFHPDPGRAPKTRAEGLRLARAIAAAPVNWGPGYVKRTPYESDPGYWPVLDANCVWQREPLPSTVLASLTRYSELPAENGKGPIRVAAVGRPRTAEPGRLSRSGARGPVRGRGRGRRRRSRRCPAPHRCPPSWCRRRG